MSVPPLPYQSAPKKRNGCLIALAVVGGLLVLGIGGCVLLSGLFVVGMGQVAEEQKAKSKAELEALTTATPSDLRPDGELARLFTLGSEHTNIQRENKEREITGKIVEWTLSVFEVTRSGNGYRVQTPGYNAIGTFTTIYPRSDSDRDRIEALKENDVITIRGYIKGTSLRNIEIDPAILVR